MLKFALQARGGNSNTLGAIFNLKHIEKRIYLTFETLCMKSSLDMPYKTVIVKYSKCPNLYSGVPKNAKKSVEN